MQDDHACSDHRLPGPAIGGTDPAATPRRDPARASAVMEPRLLFPWLAAAFVVLAGVARCRRGRWRGAPLTWLWLALCFAAVALWLRVAS